MKTKELEYSFHVKNWRIGQIAWFLTILYLYGSNCVVNFRLLYLAVCKVFCTFVSQFEA